MNEHNNYANTSMIENYLYTILNGAVSNHVFASTVPNPQSSWQDMVLIDCDLPVIDNGPFSSGVVYIFLYARPHNDDTKNLARLAQMEEALNNVLNNAHHPHYSITRQSNGGDYDTTINWHRNYVHLNITITD